MGKRRLPHLFLGGALLLSGCEISELPPSSATSTQSAGVAAAPRAQLEFVRGYEAGFRLAHSENRPMLVFFTAQWCRYCHEMADETFGDPQVVALGERFVCIQVDADNEARVCEQLGVQAFPTVQFLSPRGVPLKRLVGKKEPAQLAYEMRTTLQAVAQRIPATTTVQR